MGSIIAIHVRPGDRVRSGQIIVEIDSRDATAQIQKANAGMREAESALDEIERNLQAAGSGRAAAEANLALTASTYHRYKALLERRSVSPQEFDEVQAKYKVADAEAERATRMLSSLVAKKNQVLAKIDQAKAEVVNAQVYASYGRVASPINGLVIAKQAEVGTMAAPGTPLLTLEDDSHYRLEASVEESHIRSIHVKDRCKCELTRWAMRTCQAQFARSCPRLIRRAAVTRSRSTCPCNAHFVRDRLAGRGSQAARSIRLQSPNAQSSSGGNSLVCLWLTIQEWLDCD
jgi:multidrug resistance efflux pump